MRINHLNLLLFLFCHIINAQQEDFFIKGILKTYKSDAPIHNVKINACQNTTFTNDIGLFNLRCNIHSRQIPLEFYHNKYHLMCNRNYLVPVELNEHPETIHCKLVVIDENLPPLNSRVSEKSNEVNFSKLSTTSITHKGQIKLNNEVSEIKSYLGVSLDPYRSATGFLLFDSIDSIEKILSDRGFNKGDEDDWLVKYNYDEAKRFYSKYKKLNTSLLKNKRVDSLYWTKYYKAYDLKYQFQNNKIPINSVISAFIDLLTFQVSNDYQKKIIPKVYSELALLYSEQGDLLQAKKAREDASKYLEIRKNEFADLSNSIMMNYEKQIDIMIEKKYLKQAITILEEVETFCKNNNISCGNQSLKYYGISEQFKLNRDFAEAHSYNELAKEKLMQQNEFEVGQALRFYVNQRDIYLMEGKIDQSVDSYQKAIKIYNDSLQVLNKNYDPDELLSVFAMLHSSFIIIKGFKQDYGEQYSQNLIFLESIIEKDKKDFPDFYEKIEYQIDLILGFLNSPIDKQKSLEYLEKAEKENDLIEDEFEFHYMLASSYLILEEYEKVLEFEKQLIINSVDQNQPLINMGVISIFIKANNELELYDKEVENRNLLIPYFTEAYGEESIELANLYYSIGDLQRIYLTQYEGAITNYKKALEIEKKLVEPNDLSLSDTYYVLAWAYHAEGDFTNALENYKSCIEIRKKENIKLNAPIRGLALVYRSMNDYENALNYFLSSLDIELKHPTRPKDLAETYYDIAKTFRSLKKYKLSNHYLLEALENYKEYFSSEPLDLWEYYDLLGANYNSLYEYKKTIIYTQKSVEYGEKYFPKQSPFLAKSYTNLSIDYLSMENFDIDKSLEYIQKAWGAINLEKYNEYDIYTTIDAYIRVYNYSKTITENINITNEIVKIKDVLLRLYNIESDGYVNYYLGKCEMSLSNYDNAIIYFNKAKEIKPSIISDRSFYSLLGRSYLKNGNQKEAYQSFINAENTLQIEALIHLNWTMYYVSIGELTKALNYLEKAVSEIIELKAHYYYLIIEHEALYENIRTEKKYIQLIQKLKSSTMN